MKRRDFIATVAAAAAAPLPGAAPRPRAPFRVIYSNDTTNLTSCVSLFL